LNSREIDKNHRYVSVEVIECGHNFNCFIKWILSSPLLLGNACESLFRIYEVILRLKIMNKDGLYIAGVKITPTKP
jgi:hypothetical protein